MISQTFTNVGKQRWADIKAALREKAGIDITTDASSEPQSHMGVKYEWSWSGEALTFIVDSTSFLDRQLGHTEQSVMSDFAAWIAGVQ